MRRFLFLFLLLTLGGCQRTVEPGVTEAQVAIAPPRLSQVMLAERAAKLNKLERRMSARPKARA